MDSAYQNKLRYLKPPPIELIDEFIEELGVSERQFERFYSIPRSTVWKIRAGERSLAPIYWRIVYEKIKPAYGVGFLHEAIGYQENRKKHHSAVLSADGTPEMDNHGRLGRLKTK